MTDSTAYTPIDATTRTPRSRVLGLVIGLFVGAAVIGLWGWLSIEVWSDVNPLLTFAGLSVAAGGLLIPFRTRWIGVGLTVVFGFAWIIIGLIVWLATEWIRHF